MLDSNKDWNLKQLGWKGFLKKLYRHHKPEGGALILRLVLGILFAAAGWWKVTHLDMVAQSFVSMGFTLFETYLVAWVELVGGVLLVLGSLTKPVCVALATVMAVSVWGTPSSPAVIYFGHDYQFVLLACFLALYVMGPGKYSLAHLWRSRRTQKA